MGDTFDDPFRHVHVQPAGGVVVEEQKRLGAGDQHVVHAHGHEILADVIVPVVIDGELELGADAVGTRHQDRLPVALGHRGQRCKAAEAGELFRPLRCFAGGRNAAYQLVTGVDVHPGVTVCEPLGHADSPTCCRPLLAAEFTRPYLANWVNFDAVLMSEPRCPRWSQRDCIP